MSSTQQLLLGEGAGPAPVFIEDLFSTYLYTGTGSAQTITNDIDLSTKGGLVWIKDRSNIDSHRLHNTISGPSKWLRSNTFSAQLTEATGLTSFNNNGFSVGTDSGWNGSTKLFVSWTFREQPKFFDVLTYTGTSSTQTITHNLGSTPGCIIIKSITNTERWTVYHRSLTAVGYFLDLSETSAESNLANGISSVTSSSFTIGSADRINSSGQTFVAYIFAHDAGGFGLAGTDNVISCGTFSTDGSSNATVSLGYEPQLLLVKRSSGASDWWIMDNIRGLTPRNIGSYLRPNTTDVENVYDSANVGLINATGFTVNASTTWGQPSSTYIYITIRRGPMKVPTVGTSVFTPVAYTGTDVDNRLVNTGIVTDLAWARRRNITTPSAAGFAVADRFRGKFYVGTSMSSAQTSDSDGYMQVDSGYGYVFSAMNGFGVGNNINLSLNQNATPQLAYAFKRAAGYFDMVYYTGTGSARTVTHNLTVVPELMMTIDISVGSGWAVYTATTGNNKYLELSDIRAATTGSTEWNNTTPTASVFTVGTASTVNASGRNYMAYLFATCAGVSKVGGYTGTGTTLQIDCGFTAGSRFVWIKRTDTTGDWYVWDSARGIIAGNDPYLLTNDTAAEVALDLLI